ncbi:MAG: cbb3-type cytochrome oxidase assembly protein CcoS [Acidobacteriota bacterium]|nr:cbb3-type cytochrome oxidase assembly protein CcoS [Blastocatellia bacterium]MDW8239105.1 cbb3-type cytochrome oxidase assembly protein CcoS [Acidobacteriota bacterium]
MRDYVYPSIFFAYFFFALLLIGAIIFFLRSFKDGYWGPDGESPKYRMLADDDRVDEEANKTA